MVYLFLVFLATLSLNLWYFKCHISSLPSTASFFFLIRLSFHFIIFWYSTLVTGHAFLWHGQYLSSLRLYSLIHHSGAEPLQFGMDDGGSFITKLNFSTNFLGVVSRSSSVKIYELDSHS
jgi:hypothetical protein